MARIQFVKISAIRITALFVLALCAALHAGDSTSFGLGKNVKYRDYFDPPNQSKLRALVTGSEAVPLGTGRVRLKNLRIESFKLNGESEGIVEAPECIYDHETRTASSAGPITAWTLDERLRIEGIGFSALVTNKSLTISNNVRTVIRDLGTNTKKP